ncbi:transmembrane protein 252 [Monodelphis domestica]|uniref:transmembrane protein 252 n=1 Tax=Monodelphis domestica TaxID=13616 RepID=UPI0024E21625|nr:transmembrane protein 252 [Monodelphis domestica]
MQRVNLTVLCCLTLLTGFLTICLGAFFISLGSGPNCRGKLILAYCLLPLGFLILLSGIFWSTYQQASQGKDIFTRVLRQNLRHGAPRVPTVDRPDFYPPSYEDSIDPEKQLSLEQKEAFNIPPPLYTESSLEFMDNTDSHREIPPSYEVSVRGMLMAEGAAVVARGGGEAAGEQGQECLRH